VTPPLKVEKSECRVNIGGIEIQIKIERHVIDQPMSAREVARALRAVFNMCPSVFEDVSKAHRSRARELSAKVANELEERIHEHNNKALAALGLQRSSPDTVSYNSI